MERRPRDAPDDFVRAIPLSGRRDWGNRKQQMPSADAPLSEIEEARLLAQAIVDTVREPLLVLDQDLRVLAASRSFYLKFRTDRQVTQGELLSALGEGQWDIGPLLALLEHIAPDNSLLTDYEVELDFPLLGRRTFLLNASKVFYLGGRGANILLAFEDVTERRLLEGERDELMRRKDQLLVEKDILRDEIQHRVANSLAIISSILLMKARAVASPESRAHLEDARNRVMSIAAVQRHLQSTTGTNATEVGPYLVGLCSSLAGSMVNDESCSINTTVGEGTITSNAAVSLGLIVTELVINALKHAFPVAKSGCTIEVSYAVDGDDWTLSVADNGCGKSGESDVPARIGLGTNIVQTLARQLDARVETITGSTGTTVLIVHSVGKSIPIVA